MKIKVTEMDDADIVRLYPITGRLDGWFFRSEETSPYAYTVEGIDKWGRKVSRMGSDPQALLARCIEDAKDIQEKI